MSSPKQARNALLVPAPGIQELPENEALSVFLALPEENESDPATSREVLHMIAARGWLKAAAAWLAKYPDPDPRSKLSKRTPLIEAALMNQSEMVAMLLKHGADPLAVDGRGASAIHEACWSCRKSFTPVPFAVRALDIVRQCAKVAAARGLPRHPWPTDEALPWASASSPSPEAFMSTWEQGWLEYNTPQAMGPGRESQRL